MYPLVGRLDRNRRTLGLVRISIHAPLAGCDLAGETGEVCDILFQSTHPLRGATMSACVNSLIQAFQSTHPLRGATRTPPSRTHRTADFNPRTPCGVRQNMAECTIADLQCQSTHPLRGATSTLSSAPACESISIHAPLAGCDASHRRDNARHGYFNPRTPCGVRPCGLHF